MSYPPYTPYLPPPYTPPRGRFIGDPCQISLVAFLLST